MKNSPLIVGLLVGLVVILLIGAVSLSFGLKEKSGLYKKELASNISLGKNVEDLKAENSKLKKDIEQLTVQFEQLKEEKLKLEKFKQKLEEDLKEQLIKQEPPAQSVQ